MRELEKLGEITVDVGRSDTRNLEEGLIYIERYDLLHNEQYIESRR